MPERARNLSHSKIVRRNLISRVRVLQLCTKKETKYADIIDLDIQLCTQNELNMHINTDVNG